jgi:hypothetical protein
MSWVGTRYTTNTDYFTKYLGLHFWGWFFSLPDENVEGRMLSDQQIPHLFVENKITVYPTIGLKC